MIPSFRDYSMHSVDWFLIIFIVVVVGCPGVSVAGRSQGKKVFISCAYSSRTGKVAFGGRGGEHQILKARKDVTGDEITT